MSEIYWFLAIAVLSYLVISVDSGFNPAAPYKACEKTPILFSNFMVVLQLAGLIFLVRFLFNLTMKVKDERTKFILLPVIVFAFPVSVFILWLKLIGC